MSSLFLLFSGAVLGLVLGSFAGMASWRWPREESWLPPSQCITCRKRLGVRDLVPVFSWLWRRGQCGCGQIKVPARYTLVEGGMGLALALLALKYGLSIEFALLATVFTLLAIITVIDFEHTIIPDGANLALGVLGLGWVALTGGEWLDRLGSVTVIGGVGIFLAGVYSRLRKRDMLGWGDVKFMLAAGLWVPLELAPVYLGVSGLLGLILGIVMNKGFAAREFPFGPALTAALAGFILTGHAS